MLVKNSFADAGPMHRLSLNDIQPAASVTPAEVSTRRDAFIIHNKYELDRTPNSIT